MTDEQKKENQEMTNKDFSNNHRSPVTGGGEREEKNNQRSVISDHNVENEYSSFFHRKCKKCDKHQKEAEKYKAGWQRAAADYQNLKKEIETMRGEWARMSEQQILEEFLPVYDNFKLAFGLRTADNGLEQQNWMKGIECIMKQFEQILKSHGVEEIKTAGETFNPELHEAVGEEESDLPEQTILRETEAGYVMRGKVIKVAKVIVAK